MTGGEENSRYQQVRTAILDQCRAAGAERSVAPAEIAQALAAKQWRTLLPAIKRRAADMALAGEIEILRKGRVVDPRDFKGVYRLRIVD